MHLLLKACIFCLFYFLCDLFDGMAYTWYQSPGDIAWNANETTTTNYEPYVGKNDVHDDS